jgi:predicted RNA methylase
MPDFSCLDDTLTGLLTQVGVDGKAVVQLGCNNGRESLSLYALGARHVVGVDQSAAFLDQARNWRRAHPVIPNSSRRTFTTCRFSCRVASTWR